MNPDHLSKCQKCNQEIKSDAYKAPQANRAERPLGVGTLAFDEVICSRCGYPYQKGNTMCPNCGTPAIVDQPSAPINTARTMIIDNPQYINGQDMQNFSSNSANQPISPNVASVNREFTATRIDCNPSPEAYIPANAGMNATVALENGVDKIAAKNSSNNFNYKKTIKDIHAFGQDSTCIEEPRIEQQPIADTHCYKLHTMDIAEENKFEISITSPVTLDLKSGDVILVGGQRFKML